MIVESQYLMFDLYSTLSPEYKQKVIGDTLALLITSIGPILKCPDEKSKVAEAVTKTLSS